MYLAFLSMNNHFEDLKRRSPPERSTGDSSHHSACYSSGQSPLLSSGSASGSSPFSKHSRRKKGNVICYITIVKMSNAILSLSAFHNSFSIPM